MPPQDAAPGALRTTPAASLTACDRVLVHFATAASWTTAAAARMGVDAAEKLHVVPAPRDDHQRFRADGRRIGVRPAVAPGKTPQQLLAGNEECSSRGRPPASSTSLFHSLRAERSHSP